LVRKCKKITRLRPGKGRKNKIGKKNKKLPGAKRVYRETICRAEREKHSEGVASYKPRLPWPSDWGSKMLVVDKKGGKNKKRAMEQKCLKEGHKLPVVGSAIERRTLLKEPVRGTLIRQRTYRTGGRGDIRPPSKKK